MPQRSENIRLVSLVVALALSNLISDYPEDGRSYLVAWILAAVCFASSPKREVSTARDKPGAPGSRGWRGISGRRIVVATILSALVVFVSLGELPKKADLKSDFPEAPAAFEKRNGKKRRGLGYAAIEAEIESVSRGRRVGERELVVRVRPGALRGTLEVPDLPWEPYAELGTGSIAQITFEYPLDTPPLSQSPPWSYEWYIARQGIGFHGRVVESATLRRANAPGIVDRLIEGISHRVEDSDGLSIVLASSLARGELLSRSTEDLFRNTGTTHLLVVSGFHVGVISRMAGKAAVLLARLGPSTFLFFPAPVLAAMTGLLVSCLYASAIGMSLTIGRALVMLAVLAIGSALGRKHDGGRSLLLTLCLMLIIWPGSLFEPGCQLTFMALAGLSAGEGLCQLCKEAYLRPESLEALLESLRFRLRKLLFTILIAPLLTCFAVSLATSPVTLLWFQQLVPLSPILNVAFIPLFTAIVVVLGGAGLILFCMSESLGAALLQLSAWGTARLIEFLQRFELLFRDTVLGERKVELIGGLSLGILYLFMFIAAALLPNLRRRA